MEQVSEDGQPERPPQAEPAEAGVLLRLLATLRRPELVAVGRVGAVEERLLHGSLEELSAAIVASGIRPERVAGLLDGRRLKTAARRAGLTLTWCDRASFIRYLAIWPDFVAARDRAQALGVTTRARWMERVRAGELPQDLPPRPDVLYLHEGWRGWPDWLGVAAEAGSPAPRWRPFLEARAFARSLHLLGLDEWRAYVRGDLAHLRGTKPEDVPAIPHREYAAEFRGYRDWLDPERADTPIDPAYRSFLCAREFVRALGLATREEYLRWCVGDLGEDVPRPSDVPIDPPAEYPLAWRGWEDWLGVAAARRPGRRRRWRPFPEAREFARGLGLPSTLAWRAYCKGELPGKEPRPADIPANPEVTYRLVGWKGYGDWLGTGKRSERRASFRPFAEARAFVRALGLESEAAWRDYCHGERPDLPPRPEDIPVNPHHAYQHDWISIGDWLGTGRSSNVELSRSFRPFEEARRWARTLGLASYQRWREFVRSGRKPSDVPVNPDAHYRDRGWRGWVDFLGTEDVRGAREPLRTFSEARAWVRTLGLRSVDDYRAWARGDCPHLPPFPPDLPRSPDFAYAEQGWMGFSDWLGNGRKRPRPHERGGRDGQGRPPAVTTSSPSARSPHGGDAPRGLGSGTGMEAG